MDALCTRRSHCTTFADSYFSFVCTYVIGYDKGDHIAQLFLPVFKASRILGFWLGLLAVWAFYFTDPTLSCPEQWATKVRHKNGDFRTRLTRSLVCTYVIGYEKRDHIAQNTIFCHFSKCRHFKASRILGFWLGLLAVWAFYFTDPTLSCPEQWAAKARHKSGDFRTQSTCTLARFVCTYVIGYEKRDHIAQNAIFCHFSKCHHFKASRILGFWLGF